MILDLLNYSAGHEYEELLTQADDALSTKNYQEALTLFRKAFMILDPASPYDLAFGAVAAAHCQMPDLAMEWLQKSLAKGLGQNPQETEQIVNDSNFALLHQHPAWPVWVDAIRSIPQEFAVQAQQRLLSWRETTTRNCVPLQFSENHYSPAPAGFARYVRRAGTVEVPYLVHVPVQYNPESAYSLVVYLHGGVANQEAFQDDDPDTANELIFQAAATAIILYPFGKKAFGWVKQPAAFQHVLTIIEDVMCRYHIDPKRVYLGGTSNGATASFWYAAYASARFAGFYAFAPGPNLPIDPLVFRRIDSTARIISVSAVDDSVYAYELVKKIYDSSCKRATNWVFATVPNGNHGFLHGAKGLFIMQQTLAWLMNDYSISSCRTLHTWSKS